jgi:hypothetical protein
MRQHAYLLVQAAELQQPCSMRSTAHSRAQQSAWAMCADLLMGQHARLLVQGAQLKGRGAVHVPSLAQAAALAWTGP